MLAKDMEMKIAPLAKALRGDGIVVCGYNGRKGTVMLHKAESLFFHTSHFRDLLLRVSVAYEKAQECQEDIPLIIAKRASFPRDHLVPGIMDCVYRAFLTGDQPEFLEWCKQIHQEDLDDKF